MLTPEQTAALDVARSLVDLGVPIFLARADADSPTGFRLPSSWQTTQATRAPIDAWEPGMALGMVMGHGLDLLDVDPRSGGSPTSLNGSTPTSYGMALTPSGGVHSFVRSMGIRSRDAVLPGIDVKAGDNEGRGRGFAFIAPTVRTSKTTGQPTPYVWATPPDLTRLAATLRGELVDESGRALAELVETARAASTGTLDDSEPYDGPTFDQMPVELQNTVTQWVTGAVAGIRCELEASADWAAGQTDDRSRGWEKLQADAALRLGRLARAVWNDLDLAEAESVFLEAAPVDGTWGVDDVAEKWRLQSGRHAPAPWPDLRDPSERDAEAWRALGVDPTTAVVAPATTSSAGSSGSSGQPPADAPPVAGPPNGESAASRYFGPGGIQAATLAGDVLALGPLRQGLDHVMWSYGGGVWSQDKKVVEQRLTRLLGQRFRTNYASMVEAIVRAHTETIDCEPVSELINFGNGLLDWRTGVLQPHDPSVPSTVQLGVDYDPDADCPAFDRFLSEVVPPDVVDTVWELVGYLMYSGNPLHKAVMLTGHGRNGKGTFLHALTTVLGGKRNVTAISLHDLVNTRFATASLFGKLANVAGDIDATYMESTATFKGITGGDTISAEHKGRDRFDFQPWAVPMFSANKIPGSADTSVGYLSRWLVIPFPHNFSGREDRHLEGRLHRAGELRGIAARGIAALPRLLDRGDFAVTTSGEAAREEFVRRVDQVRTWLDECCLVGDEHPWMARTALYEAYKTWAARDGHKPVKASEFYDRLESAGGVPAVLHGTRGFKRIRIVDGGGYGVMPMATMPSGTQGAPDGLSPAPAPVQPSVGLPEAQSAPDLHPHVSAGQTQSLHNQGAEGAETPHPPYVRDAQVGGLETPAPSAPKPKRGSVAASAKAAEAREARRAAAVAEASGPILSLPAVLTADGTVRAIDTAAADQLLATITGPTGDGTLTVDVEHTGYPIGHRDYRLRTVQLGGEHFALVLDPGVPDQADVVRRHLEAATVLHAHSATADLVPLTVAGLVDADAAWSKMVDTGLLAKLADPASTGNDADLKSLARNVLRDRALSPAADAERAALYKAGKWLTDVEVTTAVERSGWAQSDPASTTMLRYAASDVIDDAALARALPRPEAHVLNRERTVQQMTARVSHRGIRLDGEHVERLLAKHRDARATHAEEVRDFGVDNPGSNPQLAEAFTGLGALLPRTAAGKPSVAKGVIEPMGGPAAPDGPVKDLARAVLDYRHHNTALVLLLEPYHELVVRGDGRARPTVYTLGADTGRMSSSRPNVQQVSREGGMRACFTADPGHLLVSADFAGVELRVAAGLSGDTGLASLMADPDRDLHWEVARLAFGPQATKAQRYAVKRGVFGRIYGGGVGAVARGVGVSEAVARQVIDAMDALTPGLAEWSRMVREGVEAGRVHFPTYAGRVIHLPTAAPHAAPNYCIQGTARELLVDALLRWRETPWGDCTLFPVHDELVVQVPEDQAAEATAALEACMTTELNGVPIIAEASEPTYAWADSA